VGIVLLAYALLRWYDKPLRAWLTRKYADPVRVPAAAAQANA
jgi:peptidoglycan/LPS O-acetylase OafA/YrhL